MPIEVQTTQNVVIDYEPAGLGYRLLAFLIDWIIIIIWTLGWLGIFFGLLSLSLSDFFDSFDIFDFIFTLFFSIPIVFYDLLFETLNNGQTPGKMLFKIRVVNTDGTAPSFGSYLLRWLFRMVDISITNGLLAVVTISVTNKGQRLGDMVAGTTVIDLKPGSKNRVLKVSDLNFREDYKVTYTDVLDKLSDRDVQTILSIMDDPKMSGNDYFKKRLANRVKDITGYTYEGDDMSFLRKVINDYNYLAVQS